MARQTAWWLNGDFAAVCAFVFLCTRSCFVLYSGGKQLVYLSRFSLKPQANDYVINNSGDKKDKVKKKWRPGTSLGQLLNCSRLVSVRSGHPYLLSYQFEPHHRRVQTRHVIFCIHYTINYFIKNYFCSRQAQRLQLKVLVLDGKLQFHSGGPKPLSCILLLLFLDSGRKKNKQIYSMHMYW